MFDAIGMGVNDRECWHLEDEDADELGGRVHGWLRSLDSKKASAWEKKLAKYQPMLMLVFTLLVLVIPRVKHTLDKQNARNLQAEDRQTERPAGPGAPPDASRTGDVASNGGENGNGTGRRDAPRSGPTLFSTTRFRPQDGFGFDTKDDT